jgi:hypothetical protein
MARPIAAALRSQRAYEGLLAMLGIAVVKRAEGQFIRLEARLNDRTIAELLLDMTPGQPRIGAPVVDSNFDRCGLEQGLRAYALRMLSGAGERWVELIQH